MASLTGRSTELIHHPYKPPEGFSAPQPGVHKASTVIFPSLAAMRSRDWRNKDGYTYGLHGTPTTFTLEARLATLEGGRYCLLTPSGLASIACVNMGLLKTGDEVLLPSNVYTPSLTMAQRELGRFGVTYQLYDPMSLDDLARKINARTKLVWLEAAGSITMEFPDLLASVQLCRSHGVLTALDNTWGAGLAFNAFDLSRSSDPETPSNTKHQPITWGVDVTIHALTKYPSGHGNLLMGSIVCQDESLYQQIKQSHMHLGFGVGANDVEIVLAGLNSLSLRYGAQDMTARCLAEYLQSRDEVAQVLHPALPDSIGHDSWQQICTDQNAVNRAAGIFSVVFQSCYAQAQVDQFCESLQLFKLGYSWGGPISLVVPYQLSDLRESWPDHIARGCLVRFCIGLEDEQTLRHDLERALLVLRQ